MSCRLKINLVLSCLVLYAYQSFLSYFKYFLTTIYQMDIKTHSVVISHGKGGGGLKELVIPIQIDFSDTGAVSQVSLKYCLKGTWYG